MDLSVYGHVKDQRNNAKQSSKSQAFFLNTLLAIFPAVVSYLSIRYQVSISIIMRGRVTLVENQCIFGSHISVVI